MDTAATLSWINPIAIQIGPLSIHWYGLMYLCAFVLGYLFIQYSRAGKELQLTNNQKDNLLISAILGIILGGRLGYILFYNLPFYLENPGKMIALWEGGLSFHGGLIGTAIAITIFLHFTNKSQKHQHHHKTTLLQVSDLIVLVAPLGLMLGRIGNFINAELYGRISLNGQWCINFPTDPTNCRYPSQLFQSAIEGLLLFIILYAITRKTKILEKHGHLSALFLFLYGILRFFLEYYREPDPQIGYLLGGPGFLQGLSMGQVLSVLTALIGAGMWVYLSKKKSHHTLS
jgi:phosphatidylglycerol---prolipoprotein diacylglyceryl transferase